MTTAPSTTDLRQLAKDMTVACRVPSFTTRGTFYVVTHAFTPLAHCTCPDFQYRGLDKGTCKHIEFVKRSVRGMASLVKKLAREVREEQGSRSRHATARGGATIQQAADVIASSFSADPLS